MSPALIDCDVHAGVMALTDLLPYMDEAWQEFFHSSAQFRITSLDEIHPVEADFLEAPLRATLDYLTRTGVAAALLSSPQATTVSGWTDRASAAVYVSAINDHLIHDWAAADSRLRVAAAVSALDAEDAAAEIKRVSLDNTVTAIALSPINVMLGDRHYYPIYAAAVEADLPVVVNQGAFAGVLLGAPAFAGGVPASSAERLALRSQIASSGLASLTLGDVFRSFPMLKIIFSDFGWEWVSSSLREFDVRAAEIGSLSERPSELAKRHIRFVTTRFDEMADDAGDWELAASRGVAELLLYGSGYPRIGAHAREVAERHVEQLELGARERLRWKAASEFLGQRLYSDASLE